MVSFLRARNRWVFVLATLSFLGCRARLDADWPENAPNGHPPTQQAPQPAPPQAPGAQGGGTASPPPSQPSPLPQFSGIPTFYGIPLNGVREVVFVLDRSGSMAEPSAHLIGNPHDPIATIAGLGGIFLGHVAQNPTLTLDPTVISNLPHTLSNMSKMEAAKSELTSSILRMDDGTRFNILFFDDDIKSLSDRSLTMDANVRAHTVVFIQGIQPGGQTAAVPALRQAYVNLFRRVVFLSDGLANVGGDRNQLLAEARIQFATRGIRMDTVGVGRDQDAPLMATLATESGGMNVSH